MTPLLPGEHVGQELEGELDVVELLLEAGQPLLDQVLGSQSKVSIVEAGGWTNHSSPGGCSRQTRSRTRSSGSANSGH